MNKACFKTTSTHLNKLCFVLTPKVILVTLIKHFFGFTNCMYDLLLVIFPEQESQEDTDMWYTHPVYARYWQHYQQAMSWYQRHRWAYTKAIQAAYDPALYPVFPTPCRYSDWQDEETLDRVPTQTGEEDNSEMEEEYENSEESELEYDVSKMDITAELRQYFAQTERHREELSMCVHEIER